NTVPDADASEAPFTSAFKIIYRTNESTNLQMWRSKTTGSTELPINAGSTSFPVMCTYDGRFIAVNDYTVYGASVYDSQGTRVRTHPGFTAEAIRPDGAALLAFNFDSHDKTICLETL